MTRRPIIKKIFFIILFLVGFFGVFTYEVYSISKKEYERQTAVFEETKKEIDYNLDMLKIAIQTSDKDIYSEKLSSLIGYSGELKTLSFIKNTIAEYLTSLDDYINSLEEHATLLSEIASLKNEVSTIESTFKDNYGDKNTITRDKLKAASDKIEKLKINTKDYSEKTTIKIVESINQLLSDTISKTNALTECIDECYADRIGEINDELAGIFKTFADQTANFNQSLEDQFNFAKMDELKQFKLY